MRKPLDAARLEEMALAYVARFATTAAKLESYLYRKVRERGYNASNEGQSGLEPGLSDPDTSDTEAARAFIDDLVMRFVAKGFVDDEGYARSKSGSMLRQGYGPRRIDMALRQAGIDETLRSDIDPEEAKVRQSALALAKKRRFGPFDISMAALPDDAGFEQVQERRARQDKQLAAMVRAGHSFDVARAVLEAESTEAAEEWAHEIDDD